MKVLVYGCNGGLGAAIVRYLRTNPRNTTFGIDVSKCTSVHHSIEVRSEDAMFPSRQVGFAYVLCCIRAGTLRRRALIFRSPSDLLFNPAVTGTWTYRGPRPSARRAREEARRYFMCQWRVCHGRCQGYVCSAESCPSGHPAVALAKNSTDN